MEQNPGLSGFGGEELCRRLQQHHSCLKMKHSKTRELSSFPLFF